MFNVFINDIFILDCNYRTYNCISYAIDTIDRIWNFMTNDTIVFIDWFKQNS